LLAARIDASEDREGYENALEQALQFGVEAGTEAAAEQACTAARFLGNLYYEIDHARAGSYYKQAIALAEGRDTPEAALEISWSATALGALYASQGERDKAVTCFEKATEAGLHCGDGQGLAAAGEATFQHGNILAESDSQEAASRYEKAETLGLRADTPKGLDTAAKAALVYGDMLERIGRTEDCVPLYERALEIASHQETALSKQIVESATAALEKLAAKE
jgi:tetratricopeptide (TPR) repeat protein